MIRSAPLCAVRHLRHAPHRIAPKKKVLRWAGGGAFKFAKWVNHPGYIGDNYMIRAADDSIRQFRAIVDAAQGAEMSTTYTYPDAYLAKFCTEAIEDRAVADIAVMGTFNAYWTEKLVVLRAYILVCLENQADPDDLFTAKLKSYRSEMQVSATSAQAQAAETRPMLTARSTVRHVFHPSGARNGCNGHTRGGARRAETDHRRRIVQDRPGAEYQPG